MTSDDLRGPRRWTDTRASDHGTAKAAIHLLHQRFEVHSLPEPRVYLSYISIYKLYMMLYASFPKPACLSYISLQTLDAGTVGASFGVRKWMWSTPPWSRLLGSCWITGSAREILAIKHGHEITTYGDMISTFNSGGTNLQIAPGLWNLMANIILFLQPFGRMGYPIFRQNSYGLKWLVPFLGWSY